MRYNLKNDHNTFICSYFRNGSQYHSEGHLSKTIMFSNEKIIYSLIEARYHLINLNKRKLYSPYNVWENRIFNIVPSI